MRSKGLTALLITSVFMTAPAAAQPHPKLIVVIIVDQMRADYLERFAPYEKGGLHFFVTQGANFLNANYDHMPTETCLGRSIVLSGRKDRKSTRLNSSH